MVETAEGRGHRHSLYTGIKKSKVEPGWASDTLYSICLIKIKMGASYYFSSSLRALLKYALQEDMC